MTSQQLSKSPLAPQGNVQILGILLCMHHFVAIVGHRELKLVLYE